MLVPKYWAEGRVQHRAGRKQVTVRRYGWSDLSQADAQANADARANDALARILAGEKLHRRDHKVPYNGAEGLPIREEVIATHGDAVITRNSYGALCLNTPNVLFADVDVDVEEPKAWKGIAIVLIATGLVTLSYRWMTHSDVCCETSSWRIALILLLAFAGIMVASIVVSYVDQAVRGRKSTRLSKREDAALERIREFAKAHPGWGLRVYRTPAGFRVLASHATFNANQREVAECFSSLRVDSVYRRMCQNQQCFRARLTAKPWRAGISAHMRPRPGVWPVKAEQMPVRAAWVAEYERVARGFAACRFIETLGNAAVHPDVRPVFELHDSMSGAHSELPLA
jgi:hypothetical protein